ncbi:hypothetical protein Ddye_028208 [Dipteronia dyeriana]|uniref:LRAT domain-containing protein n=1 Tax=Dipteronia dyeriana TaxID=168575 RepID=A0AAD9WS49_9ROSI|nr:hypothetical protein Ddye_028208 [Dipteronia dyeriana]
MPSHGLAFLTKSTEGHAQLPLLSSDPPRDILYRAKILLENGFADDDVFKNNCEDFAIYCKTDLKCNRETKSEDIMGLLSNKIDRQELKPGDHIYCWRLAFIYAHHGIYIDDGKVIHFTQGPEVQENGRVIISSCLPDPKISDVPCPQCGDNNSSSNNGVILSCIDCFLSGGELKLFEYGVSWAYFLANVRGGTCTLATSDPPGEVLHRANILLENGFGVYDVFKNNCEDFAIYCKIGLLVITPSTSVGKSGQVAALEATSKMVFSSVLPYIFKGVTTAGSGVCAAGSGVYYCYNRLNSDIGVRRDVAKVAVETLVRTAPPAPAPAPVETLVPPAPPAPAPAPVERLVPPAPAVSYGVRSGPVKRVDVYH